MIRFAGSRRGFAAYPQIDPLQPAFRQMLQEKSLQITDIRPILRDAVAKKGDPLAERQRE
ncbi:hypothetical protein D3C76_1667660 [compost metagenome]